jgi:hypothetical protein
MKVLDVAVALIFVAWLAFGGGVSLLYRKATASMARRIVLSVLLIWILADAALTFRDWMGIPLYLRLYGFFGSALWSLIFVAALAFVWGLDCAPGSRHINKQLAQGS